MATVYLDTSALGRVLLGEPDATAVLNWLGGFQQRVASWLLRIELRRLAMHEGLLADADRLLRGVALLPPDDAVLATAETIPPASIATLDAIHLATALRLFSVQRLDALMTYDARLARGARHHGITVLAPA
ncbi:MAG: type II toxin-antitoxin system VapC family toxin [Solirubrobacterales bacterium]|nr:type II toxin-antitoxin system VapC family toxin [Solirubrobacterales bacterium]